MMTANQLEYNKLVEQARHNRASEELDSKKLDETKRANLSTELETRRTNVAKENISREGNASKIRGPWGLFSLAGERAVYGTDTDTVSQDYIDKGNQTTRGKERQLTANPISTLKNIYDNTMNRWQRMKDKVSSNKSTQYGGN